MTTEDLYPTIGGLYTTKVLEETFHYITIDISKPTTRFLHVDYAPKLLGSFDQHTTARNLRVSGIINLDHYKRIA